MITEVFQVCHWLAKLAAAGLLDLVLQYTAKSEAQSEALLSVSQATLPGLPVELIGEIAGHLDSASLHNLRNTTKWLAAAVNYHYTERHPTYTICRHARQLPGFLKQLNMPAINMHIKSLTLSDLSATPYPEFPSKPYLPHLKRLALIGITMNGRSLLNMCSIHQATLRCLKIHRVYINELGHWDALLFQILVLLKLNSLQAQDLLYKSDFTGFMSKVHLPIQGRIHGLEGLEGRDEIKQLMYAYFIEGGITIFNIRIDRVALILREADGMLHNRRLHARGSRSHTRPTLDAPLHVSSHD